jgi:hypothetical protein
MAADPQTAAEYDDRTTAAVKSVLVEIGQILGSFRGRFVVIGGAVPWLLLDSDDMRHVGILDIDLSLHAEALGDGAYATLVEALLSNGYRQGEGLRRFQLVRRVPANDGGPPVNVVVDFLMPRDAEIARNIPPLITDFAVQRASGADLALRFHQILVLDGPMPNGGRNRVEIAVASIPAFLAMKGFAIHGRHKQKHAYDIYFSVRNYPGGFSALAEACRPLLAWADAEAGFRHVAEKFDTVEGYGPTCVRRVVEASHILGERTAAQWQRDAFGQVQAWLGALGFRE